MASDIHLSDMPIDSPDWSGAGPLADIGDALERAGDGGVIVGFPEGRETPVFWRKTQADVSVAGTDNAPFRLHFGTMRDDGGVDPVGQGHPPLLRMSGAAFPTQVQPDPGGQPFVVLNDAKNLEVRGPSFEGSGAKGFFRLQGDGNGLIFSDVHARMAGRVIETEKGTRLRGVEIRDSSAYGLIRGFARFHDLSDAVFSGLDLDAGGVDGGGTRVCQIISIIKGTNLLFDRVHLRRAVNLINAEERGSTYIQGDGIVLEENTARARFIGCHARDMGDAGFDMKCDGIHFEGCSMRRCKYGVRVWRDNPENRLVMCTITDPAPRPRNAAACVWLGGQVTLEGCQLSTVPDSAAIRFGKGHETDTRVATMIGGSISTKAGGDVLAGEPGRLILDGVDLDGERISGTLEWTGRELIRR